MFEVEDGKGNKVLKKKNKSDDYGIASTRFALASVVNMGAFTVRALLGDTMGQKSVEVSRYALPKFDVGARAPTRRGTGRARPSTPRSTRATSSASRSPARSVVIEATTLDVSAQRVRSA